MEKNNLLRRIPKVDDLLRMLPFADMPLPLSGVTDVVRQRLNELRKQVMDGTRTDIPPAEVLCQEICALAHAAATPGLRPVINATGIPLHTNLGRSCLSKKAVQAVCSVAGGYSTLEYDLDTGKRGSRCDHVEKLLCRLTGAEAAMAVNNNAAAVLLALSCLAKGGEVVASRGELVEIGGSFRVPEIVAQCGCQLYEVGTTNKTHLRDYEAAVRENTAAFLKVHTSNYRILGFTEAVPLADLVSLAHRWNLPVVEDLGSGCLLDLSIAGIQGEPTVMDSVQTGVDVITFSGDKLLGGPQAGIILGKSVYVNRFKTHPLARAVRLDKMALAALEATLYAYLDPEQAMQEIPTLRMLTEPVSAIFQRAERLCQSLVQAGIPCDVIPEQDPVGGGSAPTQLLPTYATAITPTNLSIDELERRLRRWEPPIIGRIAKARYLLDARTICDSEVPVIVQGVREALL